MRVLAVDQGTSSTRALMRGADGRLHLLRQLSHRQILPRPGHVEQDPEELLAHVAAAAAAAEADLVGLANQGESCLGWDARDGRPISPVIVWQDDRTAGVTRQLQVDGLGHEVMARAGLPLDPYFSASKLGWIMRHIPEAADLAALGRLRLGTTDAFFRDRLTGRFQTDIATASRTSLMNLATGAWDPELCRIFGVPREALPAITPTAGDLGRLPGGARLAASIVDQQAALFGHGCRRPGDAKVTFGTGAFVQCLTDGLIRPDRPGPLPTVAWQMPGGPVVHALDGAVYTAAAAVNWARGLGLFRNFDEVSQFAGPAAIDGGLVFLPALAGLACPHWDRGARGAWIGLSLETGPQDMMRALLEGVALRVAETLASIEALQPLTCLSVDGGMARNDYLLRFLAGLVPLPVFRGSELETTALGLVQMARAGAGLEEEASAEASDVIAPEPDAPSLASQRMSQFAMVREGVAGLAARLGEAGQKAARRSGQAGREGAG